MHDFQGSPELVEVDMPGDLVGMAERVQDGRAASIPVRGSMLGGNHGLVQGYWTFARNQWRPRQVRLLPEGVQMKVPAGSAICVLNGYKEDGEDHWVVFEFPRPGMMFGPLLWGEDERGPISERNLVLDRTKVSREKKAILGAVANLILMVAFAVFVGNVWGSGLGIIPAVASLLGLPLVQGAISHFMATREKRRAADFPSDLSKRFRVELPQEVKGLVDYLSTAAKSHPDGKSIDALDEDLAKALGSYRATYRKVEEEAGVAGGTKALLRHTRKLTDEISSNILAAPHLMADDDLRRDFLDLVGRAEADLRKALKAKQVDEIDSVKADIEMLRAQIEQHGVAV